MRRNRVIRTAAGVTGVAVALSLFVTAPVLATTIDRGGADVARGVSGPCPLVRLEGEAIQAFSKRLIECAATRWPVEGGAEKAICIAQRESGLIPTASSPTGMYVGLFQHSAADWPRRYERVDPPVLAPQGEPVQRPHERDRHDPHGERRRLGPVGGRRLLRHGPPETREG